MIDVGDVVGQRVGPGVLASIVFAHHQGGICRRGGRDRAAHRGRRHVHAIDHQAAQRIAVERDVEHAAGRDRAAAAAGGVGIGQRRLVDRAGPVAHQRHRAVIGDGDGVGVRGSRIGVAVHDLDREAHAHRLRLRISRGKRPGAVAVDRQRALASVDAGAQVVLSCANQHFGRGQSIGSRYVAPSAVGDRATFDHRGVARRDRHARHVVHNRDAQAGRIGRATDAIDRHRHAVRQGVVARLGVRLRRIQRVAVADGGALVAVAAAAVAGNGQSAFGGVDADRWAAGAEAL